MEVTSWEVYYGSRNTKSQMEVFSNVVSACLALIHKLCSDEQLEIRLGNEFLDRILIKQTA